MSPTLKARVIGHGTHLGRKWLTDVSQISTRSGRDTGLLYAKVIFCHLSTMHERDRQTDHGTVK